MISLEPIFVPRLAVGWRFCTGLIQPLLLACPLRGWHVDAIAYTHSINCHCAVSLFVERPALLQVLLIGTARLLSDGEIGRLSVLKDWRGLKVGDALLNAVIDDAERRGLKPQKLSAQVHATAFYQRHGFTVVSAEFLEAGLPHVDMVRDIR